MEYLCLHYRREATGQQNESPGQQCPANGGLLGDDATAVVVNLEQGTVQVYGVDRLNRPDRLERYWIIQARDLNDAIRIGGRILSDTGGYLEVRPILGTAREPYHLTGTCT
jgi:hypothetical protein